MPTSHRTDAVDFLVKRDDLNECRFVAAEPCGAAGLEDGHILVRIDSFAFTSNNITYAVFGEMMGYWNFFPAADGWGRVPVWGFADVVESRCEGIEVGERIFGYFPMSTYLVLEPQQLSPAGFVDGTPHRASLHRVYNQYARNGGDPGYDRRYENQQMLFRPLFMTSFLLDDFLADNEFFGAQAVILSSASSKTAFGLALLLSSNRSQTGGSGERRPAYEIVGLSSERNLGFVEGLGCYDRVVAYDGIEDLPADVPVVFVDMAGNGELRARLHRHFSDNMKYSCMVGATHWDRQGNMEPLPGASPTLFFAPDQVSKRTKDWGAHGVQRRFAEAWKRFLVPMQTWTTVVEGHGPEQVERVYREMLAGRSTPDRGCILSVWPTD